VRGSDLDRMLNPAKGTFAIGAPSDLGQPPVKNNRTTSSLLNRWLAAG
jgi:hypothetical protein